VVLDIIFSEKVS